jgi:PAS domain S-box-containing protein
VAEPIAVLIVDDDPDDRLLTRALLDDIDPAAYRLTETATFDAGLEAMTTGGYDVCLIDYRLGASDGLDLLRQALDRGCTAPVILLAGLGARSTDETAMRMGAADYLVKGQITPALLERSIRHAIDRARTLKALRESDERFRLLVDGVSDHAIFLLTATGHVDSWNAGAERMTGYVDAEVVGTHFSRFYTEHDTRRGLPSRLLHVAQTNGPARDEGWRLRKDGSRFWAEATVTALWGEDGQLRGYAKVVRDITDRLRAKEEHEDLIRAQAAHAEAEAATQARDEFLTVIAHELKTPLTSILAAAQLVLRQVDEDPALAVAAVQHRFVLVEKQTQKMSRLINRLLDLSRMRAGRLDLEREEVDLVRVVTGAIDAARFQTNLHSLVLHAPDRLVMSADQLRLEQVLTNLLDNAIKYSPHGGQIEIDISVPVADSVRLSVRDYGLGIPAELRVRVFEQFFRAHQTDHRSGMGIGLYVSQQIVGLHGGTIGVEAPSDGGSRFVVELPIHDAATSRVEPTLLTMSDKLG